MGVPFCVCPLVVRSTLDEHAWVRLVTDLEPAAAMGSTAGVTPTIAACNAVTASFFLNGFCFATWAARIPEVRSLPGLGNAELGLVPLMASLGSMLALPLTGALVERRGAAYAVRLGACLDVVGAAVIG